MEVAMFWFLIFGNNWSFRIIQTNLFIFGLVVVACFLINNVKTKKQWFGLVGILLILVIAQIYFDGRTKVSKFDNEDLRLQEVKLQQYPYKLLRLGYYLDGRHELTVYNRIKNNFGQAVDINYYFFANHPRERGGLSEFEKFPYIMVPFFIYGLFIKKERKYFYLLGLILILLSVVGIGGDLGAIVMFPFIVYFTKEGLVGFFKGKKRGLLVVFFVWILVLIQMWAYGKY